MKAPILPPEGIQRPQPCLRMQESGGYRETHTLVGPCKPRHKTMTFNKPGNLEDHLRLFVSLYQQQVVRKFRQSKPTRI